MKWFGIQVERVGHRQFFESRPILGLRVGLMILGGLGLIAVVLSLLVAIPGVILALAILAVAAALAVWSWGLYVGFLVANQDYRLGERDQSNILNYCDFATLGILKRYRQAPAAATLWLWAAEEELLAPVFYRLGLTKELIAHQPLPQANNETWLTEALRALINTEAGSPKLISAFDLLQTMTLTPEGQTILNSLNVTTKEVANLIAYYRQHYELGTRVYKERYSNYRRSGGFAAGWATAYTVLLDDLTTEITADIARRNQFYPLYSRQNLVDEAILALSKTENHNLLLVGQPETGRQELFLHLAERILNYQTHSGLDGSQVRVLNPQRLLTLAGNQTELQALFERLFNELNRAGNVVLFIENLEALLDPQGKLGTVNAATLLETFLDSAKIRLVGAITHESFIQLIKANPLLNSQFSSLEIPPPSQSDRLFILLDNLPVVENRHRRFFLMRGIKELLALSQRYLKDTSAPGRDLSLAETIAAHSKEPLIVEEQVRQAVEQISKVPLTIDQADRGTLLNLGDRLHQRIIGQDRAIKQLSDAMLRARAGLSRADKPIGAFLFLGPTGVGKTETAKALATVYFGSTDFLIRLDMTEYADQSALQKLLGSDPESHPGSLTVAIENRPASVLLLDEIEKASPEVRNVTLQLLDEGRLTTNFGRVLDFTNSIVIATSNAGSEFIKEQISHGSAVAAFEKTLIDKLLAEGVFQTEFLNRFDAVIVFSPLTLAEMKEVVSLQLQELRARLKQDKGLDLVIGPTVIEQLAQRGYDPVFGARALQRVIKSDLETAIARELIAQQPKSGSELRLTKL